MIRLVINGKPVRFNAQAVGNIVDMAKKAKNLPDLLISKK